MLSLLISILIFAVIISIVWWIWTQIPVPPPFRWIGAVVIGVIALVFLLELVSGGLGAFSLGLHPRALG